MNEEEEKVEEKPSKARGACVCALSLFYRRESALFVFFILSSFFFLQHSFFFSKERKR